MRSDWDERARTPRSQWDATPGRRPTGRYACYMYIPCSVSYSVCMVCVFVSVWYVQEHMYIDIVPVYISVCVDVRIICVFSIQ